MIIVDPSLADYQKERGVYGLANLQAGVVLLTVWGAALSIDYPISVTPIHWDGNVFFYDNIPTLRVVMSLAGKVVIGLSQDSHSDRHIWLTHSSASTESLISQFPQQLQDEARRLSERFLLVQSEDNSNVPCITAAFWSTDGWWLDSAEPWDGVMANGAEELLKPALARVDQAIEYLQEIWSLSDRQLSAIVALYERRMAIMPQRLTIRSEEMKALSSTGAREIEVAADFIQSTFKLSDADANEVNKLPPFGSGSADVCRDLLAAAGIDVI